MANFRARKRFRIIAPHERADLKIRQKSAFFRPVRASAEYTVLRHKERQGDNPSVTLRVPPPFTQGRLGKDVTPMRREGRRREAEPEERHGIEAFA